MTWRRDPLEDRRAERERLLGLARAHATRLAEIVALRAAVIAGSVARGDFNVWSDVDLVVVSDELPADWRARAELLSAARPPRVEVHGYTSSELDLALARGDALAREAVQRGVVVLGALDQPRGGPSATARS